MCLGPQPTPPWSVTPEVPAPHKNLASEVESIFSPQENYGNQWDSLVMPRIRPINFSGSVLSCGPKRERRECRKISSSIQITDNTPRRRLQMVRRATDITSSIQEIIVKLKGHFISKH